MADQTTPQWLIAGISKWSSVVIKEEWGRVKLEQAAGLTPYQAKRMLDGIRVHQALGVKPRNATAEGDENCDPGEESYQANPIEPPTDLSKRGYYYDGDQGLYVTHTPNAPGGLTILHKPEHERLIRLYSNWDGNPQTINQICAEFLWSRPQFDDYKRAHGITHDKEPFSREELLEKSVEEMEEEVLQSTRQQLNRSVALAKQRQRDEAAANWLEFEKVVLNKLLEAVGDMPKRYVVPKLKMEHPTHRHLLLVSPADLHWGMLAWEGETIDPYDRKEAERRLFYHVNQCVNRLRERPERVLLILGNDWFHVDAGKPETRKGTPVDIDGRPADIVRSGCYLAAKLVDSLRQIAPVDIKVIPGNHDVHNSLCVRLFLEARYAEIADVNVDVSDRSRSYYRYGQTLMGFDHGKYVPDKRISEVLKKECREDWGATQWHTVFCGHLHKPAEIGDEEADIYYLPSLAGVENYAYKRGFVCSDPGIDVHVVDYERGPDMVYKSRQPRVSS